MNTFKLPDETRVSRVHLRTANLAGVLEFYQKVLGLRVIDCGQEASLSATGSTPALLVFTEARKATPRPHPATGLYHFAIRFPTRRDLVQAFLRVVAADYPLDATADHGMHESIYLRDPDGNGVELTADRPRSQWPIAQGPASHVHPSAGPRRFAGNDGRRPIPAIMGFAAMAKAGAFKPPPIAVTTTVATASEWQPTMDAIGTVTAINGVTVSTDLAGIVDKIAFTSGTAVKAGDLLVHLNTDQEETQLGQAQLDLALLTLNRDKGLVARRTIAQSDYDAAEREIIRRWLNQTEVTVKGRKLLQEDSPDEIGAAIADFIKRVRGLGKP